MSGVWSPSSAAEVLALCAAVRPTADCPPTRQVFSRRSLEALLAAGQRAPEFVWVVGDLDRPDGLVAGRRIGADLALLDLFALPADRAVAATLVEAATVWARGHGEAEASFYSPAVDAEGATVIAADVGALRAALEANGWRPLVLRRHYEFAPPTDVGAGFDLPLRLEVAAPGDEERLRRLLVDVLAGSLDVRDIEHVEATGAEAAAAEFAAELVDADPIECIRFAVDDDGRDVAMVSGVNVSNGRAYLLQVGVAADVGGRRYGRALVAAMSRQLVAAGATTLIADTDDSNTPMVRAFAAVGWRHTEWRHDFTLTRKTERSATG